MAPEIHEKIGRFLRTSRQPAAIEPGEDPIPITADNFRLSLRGESVTLEVWSETRNLVRRIRGIHSERRNRLELEIEKFAGRSGKFDLVDLAHPANREASRRGARLKYRERFHHALLRQFPGWRVAELSTEPDLRHSLSPSYPRALLTQGATAMAAIGAAEDSLDPAGALSFGLIWLDYLRRRENRRSFRGLAIFLPEGREHATCHRLRYLDPAVASYSIFLQHAEGEEAVNPFDYTNFDTRIEPCRQPLPSARPELVASIECLASLEGVERRDHPDGSVSLAVRGIEFARATSSGLVFGIDQKYGASGRAQIGEIEALALGLARMRHPEAPDRGHPLYLRHPEAWLEAQVRANLERLDASLVARPCYGQVPQFAAGERGILDILAVDRGGRLAILEVKAEQDVHLPLQALDYWMRVKWHLERGEFRNRGYFPSMELKNDPPRLLLVAPALDFHPSNEVILRFFAPEIEVERLGVGIEWRKEARLMFRASARPCPSYAR